MRVYSNSYAVLRVTTLPDTPVLDLPSLITTLAFYLIARDLDSILTPLATLLLQQATA